MGRRTGGWGLGCGLGCGAGLHECGDGGGNWEGCGSVWEVSVCRWLGSGHRCRLKSHGTHARTHACTGIVCYIPGGVVTRSLPVPTTRACSCWAIPPGSHTAFILAVSQQCRLANEFCSGFAQQLRTPQRPVSSFPRMRARISYVLPECFDPQSARATSGPCIQPKLRSRQS